MKKSAIAARYRWRVKHRVAVNTTIHRTFRAIGMPYVTKPKARRRPKHLRLFEKISRAIRSRLT